MLAPSGAARRRASARRALQLSLLSLAAGLTCRDQGTTGPGLPSLARLAVVPTLERIATAPQVVLARARVTVVALPSGPQLIDTVANFPADGTPLSLDLTLVLSSPSQEAELRVAGITAAGDTVYRSVSTIVVTANGGAPDAIEAPLEWAAPDTAVRSLRVLPRDTTFRTTDQAQFRVVAKRADSTEFANPFIGWTSADTNLATFSADGRLTAKRAFTGLRVVAGLGNGLADTTLVSAVAPVATVAIAPDSTDVVPHDTLQLAATARDAANEVLAGRAIAWASLDAAVSVSATGRVIALAEGRARVVATSEGKADTAIVRVRPAPVASVALAADSLVVTRGDTARLAVVLRDGRGHELAGRAVTFSSASAGVSVDAAGLVTGVRADSVAAVVATSEGVSDTVVVRVARRPVATVAVVPDTGTVLVGGTRTLAATPRDSSGAENRDHPVAWTSLDAAVAAVSDAGVVSGVAVGATRVRATAGGVSGEADVVVVPVPVASLEVAPDSALLRVGTSLALVAVVKDSAGTPLGGRATAWTSRDPAVATVGATTGAVSGVAPGVTWIVGTSEARSDSAKIVVTAVPVAAVDATPDAPTVRVGLTRALAVVARDSAGGVLEGRAAAWTSRDAAVAAVDAASGIVTGVAPGTAWVVATVEGIADSVLVTVAEVPVAGVAVSPRDPSVAARDSVLLVAAVTDSTGAPAPGRAPVWTSRSPDVATVDAATGWVTGVAVGGAWIVAAVEGVGDSTLVTVTAVPVASVEVTPDSVLLRVSTTASPTATARDAEGAALPGRSAAWESRDAGIATVEATTGVVRAVGVGTTHVVATIEGQRDSLMVVVTEVPVGAVVVSPRTATLVQRDSVRLEAAVSDTAGGPLAGRPVRWSSASDAIATVDSITGWVRGVGVGSAYVRALLDGRSDSALVTVTPLALSCGLAGTTHTGVIGAGTWTRAASPHLIRDGNVYVEGGTLAIEAGALVCADAGLALVARNGGRLEALGTAADSVHFRATDPDAGWAGIVLTGSAADSTRIAFAVVERAGHGGDTGFPAAIFVDAGHALRLTDTRLRQNINRGVAFLFDAAGGRATRVVVDTVAGADYGFDVAASGVVLEDVVARHTGRVGVHVNASGAVLRGVSIVDTPFGVALSDAARGTTLDAVVVRRADELGVQAQPAATIADGSAPPLVTESRVAFQGPLPVFERLYPTTASQSSLLGNLTDSILVRGGYVEGHHVALRRGLVFAFDATTEISEGSSLTAEPGARLVFAPGAALRTTAGGRLVLRGTAADSVHLVAADSVAGWRGLALAGGADAARSEIAYAEVLHAEGGEGSGAIAAVDGHALLVEHAHVRGGRGAGITVLAGAGEARLRQLLVEGVAGHGIVLAQAGARLDSSTVRDVGGSGVVANAPGAVYGNLVTANGGNGVVVAASGVTVARNRLVTNGAFGVALGGDLTAARADTNYWGDDLGPKGTNGDDVADGVVFSPWLRADGTLDSTVVGPAPVARVALTPETATVLVADSVSLSAVALDSAGNALEGRAIAWSTPDAGVAELVADGATALVIGRAAGTARVIATSEGVADTTMVTVQLAPVADVAIAPSSAALLVSDSLDLAVALADYRGRVLDGRAVTWRSLDEAVAQVLPPAAGGTARVRALAAGAATIVAESEGVADSMTVAVSAVPVASVDAAPDSVLLRVGTSAALSVVARDSVGGTLSGRATAWTSRDPEVASVDAATGVVAGVGTGVVFVAVEVEGKTDSVQVVVTEVPVSRVVLTPATADLFERDTVALGAAVQDSAGGALAGRAVVWSTPDAALVEVFDEGAGAAIAIGRAAGVARVIATSEGVADTSLVTVRAAPVADVAIAPTSASVVVGDSLDLTAALADYRGRALSDRATAWRTLDESVAIVEAPAAGPAARVRAIAAGVARIVAESEGVADTVEVSVAPKPVAVVDASPDSVLLRIGTSAGLTAVARDDAGDPLEGRTVAWTSRAPAVAAVDAATGVVSGAAVGETYVIATVEGKSDSVHVTVTEIPIGSVTVAPSAATVAPGDSVQLTATVVDSAGAPSARAVTWTSAAPGVVTVDATGWARAVAPGSAYVRAVLDGQRDSALVTVPEPVTSVAIAPSPATVEEGESVQLAATTTPAGRPVEWASDNPAVASVDASGLVTGVSAGSTTIRATSEGIAGIAAVHVLSAAPIGSTRSWTGAVSALWSEPTNWYPAGIPTAADTVYIRSGVTPPTTTEPVAVGGLLLAPAATLNIGAGTITVAGDLLGAGIVEGDAGSAVVLTGVKPGATLAGAALRQVRLEGPVAIDGSVSVSGTFATAGSGRLLMRDASDQLAVGGAVSFEGTASAGDLTAGLLIVNGTFTAGAVGVVDTAFFAQGAHVTRLGGASPVVTLRHALQQFAGLELSTTGTTNFSSASGAQVRAAGPVRSVGSETINGNLRLLAGASLDASAGAIGGNLLVRALAGGITVRGTIPELSVESVSGTVALSDSLRARDGVRVLSGTLRLAGHRLVVERLFEVIDGRLAMTDPGDTLDVGIVANFLSDDANADSLTAGVLIVRGELNVEGPSFGASGAHRTELRPTGGFTHFVSFEDAAASRFHHLLVDGPDSLVLVGTAAAGGSVEVRTRFALRDAADALAIAGDLTLGASSGLLAPGTLTYCGTLVDGGGTMLGVLPTRCVDPVQFASVSPDPASVRPGETVALAVTADDGSGTTSVVTGRATRWESLDPSIATIDARTGEVTGVALGTARVVARVERVADTATVHVAAGGRVAWVGGDPSAPADWHTAANWSPARVPTETDTASVAGGTTPYVGVPAVVGGLVVADGASVVVDPAAELAVMGDASLGATGGVVRAAGGGGALRLAGTGTVRGRVQRLQVGGEYTLSGRVDVVDDAVATGALVLGGNTMTVGGTFATLVGGETPGYLVMNAAADSLDVGVAAHFLGGSTAERLTAGTLVLRGGFEQRAGWSDESFAPSAAHRTVFAGTAAQTALFEMPDVSGFGALVTRNTGAGVRFLTDARVSGAAELGGMVEVPDSVFVRGAGNLTVPVGASVANAGRLMFCGSVAVGGTVSGNPPRRCDEAVRIAITPDSSNVAVAATGVLGRAAFNLADEPVAGGIGSWTSLTPTIVAVNAETGAITGLANGRGLVQAAMGALSAEAVVIVGTGIEAANVVTWVGGAGSRPDAWSDAANWSPPRVPTAEDTVVVPASAPAYPRLDAEGALIAGLDVRDGATLDLAGNVLLVSGHAATGAVGGVMEESGEGAVALVGAGTVRGRFPHLQAAGAYTVAGRLDVTNLLAISGTLHVNGNTVVVDDGLVVTGPGLLRMTTAGDSVNVRGPAAFQGASTVGMLTQGTLVLRDDFVQGGGSEPRSFAASGEHVTVFANDGGDSQSEVSFLDPTESHFGRLVTRGPNWTVFVTDARARGAVHVFTATSVQSDAFLHVDGALELHGLLSNSGRVMHCGTFTTLDEGRVEGARPWGCVEAHHVTVAPRPAAVAVGGTTALSYTTRNLADSVLTVAEPPVSWFTRDAAIATVSPTGVVSGVRDGTTWIVLDRSTLGDSVEAVVGTGELVTNVVHWVGGASSEDSWNVASHWSPARVPTLEDTVVIEAAATDRSRPRVGERHSVGVLYLQEGAVLNLATFGIAVQHEIAVQAGATLLHAGSDYGVVLSGADTKVRGVLPPMLVNGRVTLTGDTRSLGSVQVVNHANFLRVGPYRLDVDGDLLVADDEGGGVLWMDHPAGIVAVEGNALFQSAESSEGFLTAGTLRLVGSLTQAGSEHAFAAGPAHRVELHGSGFANVALQNPQTSRFGTLVLNNAGGRSELLSDVVVQDTLVVRGDVNVGEGLAIRTRHFQGGFGVVSNNGVVQRCGSFSAGDVEFTGNPLTSCDQVWRVAVEPTALAMTAGQSVGPLELTPYNSTDSVLALGGRTLTAGTGNPAVATVSGRTVTAVRPGSTVVTFTVDGVPTSLPVSVLAAGPAGTTHTWMGGAAGQPGEWAADLNWLGGSAPTSSSVVWIPVGATTFPLLGASATVAAIALEEGAQLDVADRQLAVSGAVDVRDGASIVSTPLTGSLAMTGTGTLRGVVPRLLVGGTVTLNGRTQATAGAELTGGARLTPAGRTLAVTGGPLTVGGTALLVMTSAADSVVVSGNAAFTSTASHSGSLTAGVLRVDGPSLDLVNGFAATGSHKTLLAGSVAQVVAVTAAGQQFQHLEVAGSAAGGVGLSNVRVQGDLLMDSKLGRAITFFGGAGRVTGRFIPAGVSGQVTVQAGTTVNADSIVVNSGGSLLGTGRLDLARSLRTAAGSTVDVGRLSLADTTGTGRVLGTFASDTVIFAGAGVKHLAPTTASRQYGRVEVQGGGYLSGRVQLGLSFGVTGTGTFEFRGHTLAAAGNVNVSGTIYMLAPTDSLIGAGTLTDIRLAGAPGTLSRGVIAVAGRLSTNTPEISYDTRGDLKFVLNGSGATQLVDAVSTTNRLPAVDVAPTANVRLNTNVTTLSGRSFRVLANLTAGGNVLVPAGLTLDILGTLSIQSSGRSTFGHVDNPGVVRACGLDNVTSTTITNTNAPNLVWTCPIF